MTVPLCAPARLYRGQMHPPGSHQLGAQIFWLFVLAIPVACVAWTVTREEIFREMRDYCKRCSTDCRALLARKFFYLFTCEYCFSHWVTLGFIALTRYRLLLDRYQKDTEAAAKVVGAVKNMGPGKLDAAEQAAWTGLANLILNLDETLTRE